MDNGSNFEGFFPNAYVFARRCATVRNRPQATVRGPSCGRASGELCKSGHFWRFQTSCDLVSRGRRGTLWHSNMFRNVSKVVLCGRRKAFATFSEDVFQFSWQAQHFGDLYRYVAWQAQHFRHVVWCVLCESHCQGCVKWWQRANSVAGVEFCEMWWKVREASHETSILRSQIFRFMRKLAGKRQFCSYKVWKSEEVSHEMLLRNLSFSRASKLVVMLFCVAEVALPDVLTCLQTCRKSFLCDRRHTCARFAADELHFSWQWQHFRDLHGHFAWQWQQFRCVVLRALHFTLQTLHSTLYIPHFTLYTLHFTLYTWHSTLYTPHSTLHTPHFTLHTPHFTIYTPHFSLYTLHSTLHTLHFSLHTAHCTLHTLHFTSYTSHFTLRTSHFTFHTLHSTLHTLHFTLHTLHFTLHTSHSTLYTLHSTHYTLHFTLRTLHSTLCTPHSTLHTPRSPLYTPHFILHTPHFTLYTPQSTLYFALHPLPHYSALVG